MKLSRLILSTTVLVSAPFALAIPRLKLQHWFPQYSTNWISAAASPCRREIINYLLDNNTACASSPCACAADCILKNAATPTIQSDISSAQVLLGLLPAIFVFVGPNITEVAALSTYRPLLAVLLALGSPAINLGRLFRRVDICEPFVRPVSRSGKLWSAWAGRRSNKDTFIRNVVRALSYMGAIIAIVNNICVSLHLDLRTISGFRCAALFMPLAWGLLAVVVHAWGMIAVRARLLQDGYRPSLRSVVRSRTYRRVSAGDDTLVSDVLFCMASLCAIVHMAFGILELSSLIFIGALEALQVFALYAVSALLCQLILLLELANMRYELSRT